MGMSPFLGALTLLMFGHGTRASGTGSDSGIPMVILGKPLPQYTAPSRANVHTARSLLGDKSEVPPLMPIFITVIGIMLVSLTLLAVMLYYVIMCFRPAPNHIHGRMQRTHARQTLG